MRVSDRTADHASARPTNTRRTSGHLPLFGLRPLIIACVGSKGGTTKSATVASIAGVLAERGYEGVTLVDLDAQGTLTKRSGFERPDDVLTAPLVPVRYFKPDATGARIEVPVAGTVRLLRGGRALESATVDQVRAQIARAIAPADLSAPSWVLLDTPPALGVLTQLATAHASLVLMPGEGSLESVEGMLDVVAVHRRLSASLPAPPSMRIAFTRVDGRTRAAQAWARAALDGDPATAGLRLNTEVPFSPGAIESACFHLPVTIANRGDRAASAYRKLVTELERELGVDPRRLRTRPAARVSAANGLGKGGAA